MKSIIFLITFFLVLIYGCNLKSGKKEISSKYRAFELIEIWETDTVFRTPESVIYDAKRDILYVTNVNLEPRLKDGNGFISQVSTDGKIIKLKWIEGLNAPKGTAIIGDTLYVADIEELVVIDIEKGTITGKITIEGIGMINDITSDNEGSLYISDSDANRIYKYSGGNLSVWLGEGLDRPNGLLAEKDRLLLASMGSMDFAEIDIKTKSKKVLTEGINRGDGIAFTGLPGYYLVSDWTGEIFLINPDYGKVSLLDTKEQGINTADITFIPEIGLLLVPTFGRNSVTAYILNEIAK
ncbi:MAG: SMP-30/gluconolactonase/LRE family protein [Bacteroidales bacterium]